MAIGFWSFEEVLSQWESMGVFNVIMPFLLFFAIIYSILDKAKILGENRQGINAIVSIVISLIAIRTPAVLEITSKLFANMAVGVVILLVLLVFLGFILDTKSKKMWFQFIFIATALIIFAVVVTNVMKDYIPSTGFDFAGFLLSPQMFLAYFVLAMIILIVARPAQKPFIETLSDVLSKETGR